jgi:CheY-like chemotaxis protein
VVEDDPDVREVVVSFLRGEGFYVGEAENGRHALELLGRMPHPALILADLMMPVIDGWELVVELSKQHRLATLPVVVVSAVDENLPTGYRRIKKPIELEDLLRIVSEHCIRQS